MELTREEAEKMITARFAENPKMGEVASNPAFLKTLSQILAFEELDEALLPIIENEVKVVLAFYAPLTSLGSNIAETTGLPLEKAERIATLVDTLLLDSVHTELENFDNLWNTELEKIQQVPEADKNLKEKLELRPDVTAKQQQQPEAGDDIKTSSVRPLTREEVLKSIAPSRTMAKDIASVTAKVTPQPSSPAPQSAPIPPAPSASNEVK